MLKNELTKAQETILLAYANACAPRTQGFDKGDLNYVMNSGLVDKSQNHITDRGAAFACVHLGLSFTRFMLVHSGWRGRRITTLNGSMTLGNFIDFTKQWFQSPEELDLFWKSRYAVLLKYDSFTRDNAEVIPADGAAFLAETLLDVLASPSIDWRKVKKMVDDSDRQGGGLPAGGVNNKADMAAYLRAYLNYKTETGYNAQTGK